MYRRLLIVLFVCACAGGGFAQDLSTIQIHGFVTQGVLYSSNNNLFTMPTSDGSARWTGAAVSISDVISDKLRLGAQFRVHQFGQVRSER
jgi:glucose dehydrogenase